MRILFTSFGITQDVPQGSEPSIFYRKPPVSMLSLSNYSFLPDYAVLLLCEEAIVDEKSFNLLTGSPPPAYVHVARTMQLLRDEGFLLVRDFDSVLSKHADLLQQMLDNDLASLDQWVDPLRESLVIWEDFRRKVYDHYPEIALFQKRNPDAIASSPEEWALRDAGFGFLRSFPSGKSGLGSMVRSALMSSRLRRKSVYRDALREVLTSYLLYVNANLILAREFEVGFHDWSDFLPFYRKKFLYVGIDDLETDSHFDASRTLFNISFPMYSVEDPVTLINILHDDRIKEFRKLIDSAVRGEVVFDDRFAKDVFGQVFESEREASRYHQIAGYIFKPLGFLPGIGPLAEIAAEESAGWLMDRKKQQGYQWLYLLSDNVPPPLK